MRMHSSYPCLLFAVALANPLPAQETRLLRHPTVSRDAIAFEYGADLWSVPRTGGVATRLTATPGVETEPVFSPDGSRIAFTATVGGNTDVYVMPAKGGDPTRLTFHPSEDRVRGWTPDGSRIVFASTRSNPPLGSYNRLFTIPVAGGFPEALPMPRAFTGDYSPDGRQIAYEEISTTFFPGWVEQSFWRHYRGGRTHPIRVMNLADHSVRKLPWTDSNDSYPMWIGNTVYFISDRTASSNLYSWTVGASEVKQVTRHDDFDIVNASAGPDAIVYEQGGYVHLLDPASGQSRRVPITVNADFPWARPSMQQVAGRISDATLSPSGVRVAVAARGEIFTVPTEKGDYRNLTRSPAVHDQNPAWSPDGGRIAWFSDASGEYQLMIGDQSGLSKPRVLALPSRGFFSNLRWSPDGTRVTFEDNSLTLWTMDVASGKATRIDAEVFDEPARNFEPVWSPDSRFLAYARSLDNHFRAIFIHSVADGKSHQITDGMSDAISPAWDASGKYLYFLASTDYGPNSGWVEMSSVERPVRRSIYLAVLSADEPSPLLPPTGDEPTPTATPAARAKPDSSVRLDVAGIGQRILALGVRAGDFSRLRAGPAGMVFYMEPMSGGPPGMRRLQRYQLDAGAAAPFLDGVVDYDLSGDRKKLLYRAPGGEGGRWGVVPTDRGGKVGDGPVNMAQLEMWVEPRAEWAEIFDESWRIQRDYFYDAKMHGADWNAVKARYGAMLPFVAHRYDLGYLIAMAAGELSVGHSYLIGSGDTPTDTPVSVGMLGADFTIQNGRYRLSRIYTGENWNPELRAPLSAPGIQVSQGDYLLEINGIPLTAPDNPYRLLQGLANRQTVLRINGSPSLEGSRLVTVVPVPSEDGLRSRAWVEDNRRLVDSLSRGKLAYVWLPNTGMPGYSYFTRYFYSQQDRQGTVVDVRYNQGGQGADYIANELSRTLIGYFATRAGKPVTSPAAGIFGPRVMVINESAGSGGDALPYIFKQRKLGPLVGTRTWGGLVGTTGVPQTIDGGGITAPNLAFYDLSGRWAVENEGIAPDIEVEYTAAEVIAGHDPQLERAVQEALRLLEENPVKHVERPAPIDRTRKP